MFGLGWQPGRATVVSRRLLDKSFVGDSGQSLTVYEYMLDVHPDDGTMPYRATTRDPFNMISWRQPEVGHEVRVKCHVGNQEVKFDHDDPTLHQETPQKAFRKEVKEARSAEAMQEWNALKEGTPGLRPRQPDDRSRESAGITPQDSGLPAATDAMAALTATINDTANTMAAIKAARAAGNLGEVARLKADFQQRTAQRSGGAPTGSPIASTAHPAEGHHLDVRIEQLEKLASLRDRGILSDAEFATEKARLLSGG